MNLLQIQYFVSVAENLSFTQASRELYVSQPSISKQVAALEDELNLKLFDRTGKQLQLTAAGNMLFKDFKRLLSSVSDIVQRAKDIGDSISGRLRIGTLRYMDISRVTSGAIAEFHRANPNVAIEFRTQLGDQLKRDFIDGNLDCLFLFNYKAAELVGCTPTATLDIFDAPIRMVYPRSFEKPGHTPTLIDFKDQTFIIVAETENNISMEHTALRHLTNAGIIPKGVIWADSVDSLLLSVESGFGIGLVGPTARIPKNKYTSFAPVLGAQNKLGITVCWNPTNNDPILFSFLELLRERCVSKK